MEGHLFFLSIRGLLSDTVLLRPRSDCVEGNRSFRRKAFFNIAPCPSKWQVWKLILTVLSR